MRYYVTAYYRNPYLPIGSSIQIRCEARGCIRNKLPMHLSSTGYFLSASLIITCSRQSLFSYDNFVVRRIIKRQNDVLSASIKGIIDAGCGICQGVSKKIVASGWICDMMFL